MRVWIDSDLCSGTGQCSEIAPDIFVLLDDATSAAKQSRVARPIESTPSAWGQLKPANSVFNELEVAVGAAEL